MPAISNALKLNGNAYSLNKPILIVLEEIEYTQTDIHYDSEYYILKVL